MKKYIPIILALMLAACGKPPSSEETAPLLPITVSVVNAQPTSLTPSPVPQMARVCGVPTLGCISVPISPDSGQEPTENPSP